METSSSAQLQLANSGSESGTVFPPVLKPGSAAPRGDQEKVDDAVGLNLLCSVEQLLQLFCGSRRAWEPVSMRTVLVEQLGVFSLARQTRNQRRNTHKFCGGVPTAIVVYH